MQSNHKILKFKSQSVTHSFTGRALTSYAGLSPIMQQITQRFGLGEKLAALFPTEQCNASKFSTAQTMMAVVLASFCGVRRLCRIAAFTHDALVSRLLGLRKGLNKDVISKQSPWAGRSRSAP